MPVARTGGDAEAPARRAPCARCATSPWCTLRIERRRRAARGAGPARRQAQRALDLGTTLDAIAFKHGAIWSGTSHGDRARGGRAAREPSRAAADAASLAVDVHEALAGASRGPAASSSAPRSASSAASRPASATSRGTSSSTRSRSPRTSSPSASAAAPRSARRGSRAASTASSAATSAGATRPRSTSTTPDGYPVPRQMRLYALQRPLTREERDGEIALSPNDLVGRDAERADLHAAYHRAISPPVKGNVEPPARFGESEPPGSRQSRPPSTAEQALEARRSARSAASPWRASSSARWASARARSSPRSSRSSPATTRVLHVECSPVKSELPLATVCDVLRDVTGMGLDHAIDDASHVIRGPARAHRALAARRAHRHAARRARHGQAARAPRGGRGRLRPRRGGAGREATCSARWRATSRSSSSSTASSGPTGRAWSSSRSS